VQWLVTSGHAAVLVSAPLPCWYFSIWPSLHLQRLRSHQHHIVNNFFIPQDVLQHIFNWLDLVAVMEDEYNNALSRSSSLPISKNSNIVLYSITSLLSIALLIYNSSIWQTRFTE
jgi:hypothetical protein